MKKFCLKTLMFILPFLILYAFEKLYFSEEGDLVRTGYVAHRSDYRKIFHEAFNLPVQYTSLTDTNATSKKQFDVLVMGDSYSGGESWSYLNYLADHDIKVLHFNHYFDAYPFQRLFCILNGDFLENTSIKYLILESVERNMVYRAEKVDTTCAISSDSLDVQINKLKISNTQTQPEQNSFFSDRFLKFALHNLGYLFDDNAYKSKTYSVKTTEELFSYDNRELLFYHLDYVMINANNDVERVKNLNVLLNFFAQKLKERGIELIVLPGPDKLDMYYDYLVQKELYTRPLFFEHLETMPKDYIYVNSKQILAEAIKTRKDVYYYDDSHWSPFGTQLIANELSKIIRPFPGQARNDRTSQE